MCMCLQIYFFSLLLSCVYFDISETEAIFSLSVLQSVKVDLGVANIYQYGKTFKQKPTPKASKESSDLY